MPRTQATLKVPPGLPSLIGLLTAAALLVAGVWLLAGMDWAFVAAAPVALLAGLGVERILDPGPPAQTGGSR